MRILHALRLGLLLCLVCMGGCVGGNKRPLQYIGHSNELANAARPNGFVITPLEARHIRQLRTGPKKTVDDFYHDGEFYYVCDGFDKWGRGRGSTESTARKVGTMINGQTGEVYNRATSQWEPDPRSEKESQQQ